MQWYEFKLIYIPVPIVRNNVAHTAWMWRGKSAHGKLIHLEWLSVAITGSITPFDPSIIDISFLPGGTSK
jgi:hypothetical protein